MRRVLVDEAERLTGFEAAYRVTSVSNGLDRAALEGLDQKIASRFGGPDVLMTNAGTAMASSVLGDVATRETLLNGFNPAAFTSFAPTAKRHG